MSSAPAQGLPGKLSVFRAIADRVWAASRPAIGSLVYANGGLGDELMLTAIAREARAAGQPLHILTAMPELWRNNSDAASVNVDLNRWLYAKRRGWIQSSITHLVYDTTSRGRHIAQQMAGHVAVNLRNNWRPVIADIASVPNSARDRIVVQNSCRGARYASTTKEWSQSKWDELLEKLTQFEIIHLGTARDPALPGVIDLRGRTTLREAAGYLAGARLFIGLESGLMHVAAAVGTPSIIVYGGRTEPAQTGYPWHHHITRTPPCAPCGLNDGCPNHLICLDIPVAEVERTMWAALAAGAPNHAA
jgi:hypothetical protein